MFLRLILTLVIEYSFKEFLGKNSKYKPSPLVRAIFLLISLVASLVAYNIFGLGI